MSQLLHELLRTEYLKDAYIDQTGAKHWGYVVYEQILVQETGERFDVDDGYKVHKDHGVIAIAPGGRRFRLWTETVSYSGGTHIIPEDAPAGLRGHWQVSPLSLAGYCTPKGTPVSHHLALKPSLPHATKPAATTWYPLTNETVDEHVQTILDAKDARVEDFIHGDAFAEAAVRTVHIALEQGTEEAFQNAVAELRGVTRAAIYSQAAPGTIIKLSNEQSRMQQMEDNPDLRAEVLASMQQAAFDGEPAV